MRFFYTTLIVIFLLYTRHLQFPQLFSLTSDSHLFPTNAPDPITTRQLEQNTSRTKFRVTRLTSLLPQSDLLNSYISSIYSHSSQRTTYSNFEKTWSFNPGKLLAKTVYEVSILYDHTVGKSLVDRMINK